jgi:hypothetical protein
METVRQGVQQKAADERAASLSAFVMQSVRMRDESNATTQACFIVSMRF